MSEDLEPVEKEINPLERFYLPSSSREVHVYYRKTEADKVIAEKDTKIIQLEALIENYNRISREIIDNANHQKYKRCLDKAKWCFTKSNYHFFLARHGEDVKDNNRKTVLYSKWYERWLGLAEKFKET